MFEVDSIVPDGATNRKQSNANTGNTRYVRTTGLSRHASRRTSSLPPPPQSAGAGNQHRRSSTSSTKSSRAVIHAGTTLPKPYTYEPLTHSSIETVPLNTDYPAGSCTINHAAGPAEPQQFYHRFKSTYGRPELNGRHGKTGYYDFRPIQVEVVRAKKKVGQGRRNVIRSMRIGKPVRRSVGLSTLWAWDFPPSWVFRSDGKGDADDVNLKRVGWIDCEPSTEEAVSTPQKDEDQGSVAAGSIAGSVVSCSTMFSVENMKRPGVCVGFGGPFPYDQFLRPEQDPYYRAGIDDEDSDRIDAKVHHHMDMLRFAALPYSFEQCWAEELNFADFDGIKARKSLPRPYAMPPPAPATARKTDRRQYPTQELLRPTMEHVERAKKLHQAARIKARQDRNKMSRVSDWRHRSAALEAEINRRRSVRRGAVGIKEIIVDDETISVDAEDISLPGVLKVMAALKPDNIANGDWSTIQSDCEGKDVATDASTTVEGLNYLSDGSTILHYLERCQEDDEKEIPAEESVAELTENGLEEDSREDSTEIKLFIEDDDKEESEDEDEEADDSLVFSKTSIAEVLANVACKVEEKRKSEASSVSTPTADIIAESERAREEWANLDGASDSDNDKDNVGNDSVHSSRSLTEKHAENREESALPHRIPRSRPLSIRLSAKKKKAWDNACDEAGLVSDIVAVARWHGEEDDVVAQESSDLRGSKDSGKEDASKCQEKGENQILAITLPDKAEESLNGESTRNDFLSRTADKTMEELDDAPPGSPEVAQTLPPEDKISLSPSPPRPIKKTEIVSVSLSQHLAATGAKGGNGMPKAGCEGSIRTMETACSTNPSEDDFVQSPYASIRKNVRPDALVGTSARSRRRALEAQFSKHTILSPKGAPDASQKGQAASLESARSLEVAILQSLKKKVDSSIGTSATNVKAEKAVDTAAVMERIRNERKRVAERSKSLRRLESAPQQVGTSAPDWNVW